MAHRYGLYQLENLMPNWFPNYRYQLVSLAYDEITKYSTTVFIKFQNFTPSVKSLEDLILVPYQPMCSHAFKLQEECGDLLEINCDNCSPNRDEMILTVAVIHRLLYPVVSLSIVEEALNTIDTSKVRQDIAWQLLILAHELNDEELSVTLKMHASAFKPVEKQRSCDITNNELQVCKALTSKQKKCVKDPVAVVDMLIERGYAVAVSTFLCEWMCGKRMQQTDVIFQKISSCLEQWLFCDSDICMKLMLTMNALGYIFEHSDTGSENELIYSLPWHRKNEQFENAKKVVCDLQQQPLSLQHFCRVTIRRAITSDTCMSTAVQMLPVPGAIIRYLMMQEHMMEPEVALLEYKQPLESTRSNRSIRLCIHISHLHDISFYQHSVRHACIHSRISDFLSDVCQDKNLHKRDKGETAIRKKDTPPPVYNQIRKKNRDRITTMKKPGYRKPVKAFKKSFR